MSLKRKFERVASRRIRRTAALTRRELIRALSGGLAIGVTQRLRARIRGGSAIPATGGSSATIIGALIDGAGSSSRDSCNFLIYKNRVRECRTFAQISNAETPCNVTGGWPATDFQCTLWEGTTAYFPSWLVATSGTPMKCGFIDSSGSTSTATIAATNTGTIANIVHGAAGQYTRFDFYGLTASGGIQITNTGNGAGTGVTNFFVYLPAYPGTTIDDPTNANSFVASAIAFYSALGCIKDEWQCNNWYNSQVGSSSTRNTPSNTQCNLQFGGNQPANNQAAWTAAPSSGATSGTITNWYWGPGNFWIRFPTGAESRLVTISTGTRGTWATNVAAAWSPGLTSNEGTSFYCGIEGYPREWHVGLGIAANTNINIGLPMQDDGTQGAAGSYCASVMTMVANAKAANPSWTGNVIFSMGNEIWNGGGGLCSAISIQGASQYGFANWQSYVGYLLHAIAVVGRTTFGAAWGTTYQLTCEMQQGSVGDFFDALEYIRTTYYSGVANSVSQDIQWGLVSSYVNYTANDGSVALMEASASAAAGPAVFSAHIENTAITCYHYGVGFGLYEANLSPSSNSLTNYDAMLRDSGYQSIIAGYINDLQNSGCGLIQWSTEGVSSYKMLGGQGSDLVSDTSAWSANNSNFNTAGYPIVAALLAASVTPPTFTRNVIGAPGAGPYVIEGGNFADSTLGATGVVMSYGAFNQTKGSPYYSSGSYYGWFVNSSTGGTYSLSVNATGSGTTNVELGAPVVGNSIPYSGKSLVAGDNSIGSVTLQKGYNYILLGNGTSQGGLTINSLTFT